MRKNYVALELRIMLFANKDVCTASNPMGEALIQDTQADDLFFVGGMYP